MDPATPEAVAERVAAATMGTWLSTMFGLALGAFVGGALGAKVAGNKITAVTSGIGLALSLWAIYTLYIVYPTVLWVSCRNADFSPAVFISWWIHGSAVARKEDRSSNVRLRQTDLQ